MEKRGFFVKGREIDKAVTRIIYCNWKTSSLALIPFREEAVVDDRKES